MAPLYISDYLRESIDSKSIRNIRGALLGYVEMDPAFKTTMFLDAINYVHGMNIPVYEEHDLSIFAEEDLPAKDRFYQILTSLHHNFSQERVQELIQVGKTCMLNAPVYKVTNSSLDRQSSITPERVSPPASKTDESSKKAVDQDHGMATRRIWVAAALVAILAVIVILLVFHHHTR